MNEPERSRGLFKAWWAVNHPWDWWTKERDGQPLPQKDRLLVHALVERAFWSAVSLPPPTAPAPAVVEAAIEEVAAYIDLFYTPLPDTDQNKSVGDIRRIITEHCTAAATPEPSESGEWRLWLWNEFEIDMEVSNNDARAQLLERWKERNELEGHLRQKATKARAEAITECVRSAKSKADEYQATSQRWNDNAEREDRPEFRDAALDDRNQCISKYQAMLTFAVELESLAKGEGESQP